MIYGNIIADSKQSKRHHAEDTLTLDSDLEESIDATGSVGSVGSSSLTSLGSGRHKGYESDLTYFEIFAIFFLHYVARLC